MTIIDNAPIADEPGVPGAPGAPLLPGDNPAPVDVGALSAKVDANEARITTIAARLAAVELATTAAPPPPPPLTGAELEAHSGIVTPDKK